MDVELKLMEYIVAVAEEKSIARAADRVYLSRSALNRQLLNLEKRLGVRLFNRLNHSLSLTYAGEVYVEMASTILNVGKQAKKHLSDIAENKTGRINLGISQGRMVNELANIFLRFYEAFPGVSIRLAGGQRGELEFKVLSGELDIAIVSAEPRVSGLNYQTLSREEVVLAVHKSHPMAYLSKGASDGTLPQLDLRWFAGDYFALMDYGSCVREITDMLFQKEHFAPKVLLEDCPAPLAYNMVKNGTCCAVLSQTFINKDDPVVCFSFNPRCYLILAIVCKEDSHLSQPERFLISLANEHYSSKQEIVSCSPECAQQPHITKQK